MYHRFVARLGLAPLAAALAVCLVARCGAEDHSPPAADSILLATGPELPDSGLLEVLLAGFREETKVEVTLCGASEQADLYLLPTEESEVAAAAPDTSPEGREVLWTTFLILGPADAKSSYGEFNYLSWARPRSPLGTPVPFITRSSASRLLIEISLTSHPIVACAGRSGIQHRELKLWGPRGPPKRRVETGEPMARTLEIASEKSAYVLSDAVTYLRLRCRLRLDVVLARGPELRVAYRAILPKPGTRSSERLQAARRLYDWLVSDNCQAVVRRFRLDGERSFYLPGEEQAKTLRGRLDASPPETEEEDG
ncbi:MAG: hypothetical protein ACE5JG_04130 [Planctomycetota bacterium]